MGLLLLSLLFIFMRVTRVCNYPIQTLYSYALVFRRFRNQQVATLIRVRIKNKSCKAIHWLKFVLNLCWNSLELSCAWIPLRACPPQEWNTAIKMYAHVTNIIYFIIMMWFCFLRCVAPTHAGLCPDRRWYMIWWAQMLLYLPRSALVS